MKERTEITMKQVADALSLSTSTVSRALQDHPHVNKKTKVKVKSMALKMGYKYNAIAASLRTNKSHVIGLIVPRISRFYQSQVITSVQNKLHENGYNLIVCQSNESPDIERELVQALYSLRVDGLIVSTTLYTIDFSVFDIFAGSKRPLIFFDRVPRKYKAHKIQGDDYLGGYESTRHLIKQGCKRIVHIGGPQMCNLYQQRFEGYRDALIDNGIPVDKSLIFFHDLTAENAIRTFDQLLALKQFPDAVISCNDTTALAILNQAKHVGMAIPKNLKVVGYSNDPLTKTVFPSISSIEQFPAEVGVEAATLMLRQLNSSNRTSRSFTSITIPVKLIPRESSSK